MFERPSSLTELDHENNSPISATTTGLSLHRFVA